MSALRILSFLTCLAVCYGSSPPVECSDMICPYIYEPVCAVDRCGNRKTFANECLLNVYNCFNEDNPMVFPVPGECESVILCQYVQYLQYLSRLAQQPRYC